MVGENAASTAKDKLFKGSTLKGGKGQTECKIESIVGARVYIAEFMNSILSPKDKLNTDNQSKKKIKLKKR